MKSNGVLRRESRLLRLAACKLRIHGVEIQIRQSIAHVDRGRLAVVARIAVILAGDLDRNGVTARGQITFSSTDQKGFAERSAAFQGPKRITVDQPSPVINGGNDAGSLHAGVVLDAETDGQGIIGLDGT